MSAELVLHASRAVVGAVERECVVVVDGGRIAAVEPPGTRVDGDRVVTLEPDEVLLPGLVDTHVHVNEPGRTDWEGFASATAAAAAGGVTTLLDMPLNSIPPTTDAAALEVKRRSADGAVWVDVGFWGGAVPGNAGELAGLHRAGVFGFKCFLADSGVPEFPPLDAAGLDAAMAELARLGALLIVHAEDAGELAAAPAAAGSDYAAFLRSRPPAAEDRAVARVIDAARRAGARAHVVHLSDAGALPRLAAARRDGVDVSVETCPHYLALTADQVPRGATEFKCCPPVRDEANRDALWAGLADGTIDMIVSDHSPCPPGLKRRDTGDFGAAWGGIASVQLGLPVVWTQAHRLGIALARVVEWMASRPADRVGMRTKGRLAVGADADFCVLAPDEEFTVDPARLLHRHPVTPYAGRRLRGVVRSTWLRGQPVEPGDPPRGRLLQRGRR